MVESGHKLSVCPAAPCSGQRFTGSVPTRLRLGETTKDGRPGNGSATLMRILPRKHRCVDTAQQRATILLIPTDGRIRPMIREKFGIFLIPTVGRARPVTREARGIDSQLLLAMRLTCLSYSFPLYPQREASAAILPRCRYRPWAPPTRGRGRIGSR